MIVKTQLRADLQRPAQKDTAYAMQNDENTRIVEISLFSGGVSWIVPAGTTCAVGYKKPDKTFGLYDLLPDGETTAVTFSGNILSVMFAPQMLTAPGIVDVSIFLYDENANRIGTFPFSLYVAEDPSGGKSVSNNYYYLSTLAAVNEAIGNLNDLKTVTKESLVEAINEIISLGGGTITEDQIQAAVDKYLKANPPGSTPLDTTLTQAGKAADAKAVGDAISKLSGGNVENGEDGFSPIATVKQTATGAVISITDKDGTTTATISNGKDGKDGADGAPGAKGDKGDKGDPGEKGETGAPDYVREEAERLAAVVQARQNPDTITFLACSDLHYSLLAGNTEQQTKTATHLGQALKLIRERVHIDFAAYLGDMFWDGGETQEQALTAVRFGHSCLHDGFLGIPNFFARGNHDNGYSSGIMFSNNQIYANVGIHNTGAVYDGANRVAGYCYRDFEYQKLRVICLNSAEDSSGGSILTQAQVTWLANALAVPDGWNSMILSHHPLDWGKNGGANPTNTLNAASGLIAAFHGHIHNFKVDTITGTEIKRIAIPNACFGRENEYTTAYGINWGEATTYEKTADSAEDTSFCVVTVDLAEKKIYADHYGAGYSRVISFGEEDVVTYTVTNTLTKVNTSNSETTVSHGAAYSATLSANSGYTLTGGTVKVTMGGTDITASAYSGGKITITNVTGDIVITASAVAEQTGPVNRVSTSIDTTQNVYNGKGYKEGYRLNSSGVEAELADAVVSGFIPYNGEVIRVYGTTNASAGTSGNYIGMYDTNFAKMYVLGGSNYTTYGGTWEAKNGKFMATIDPEKITNAATKDYLASAKYIRVSMPNCTGANLIVTLNEEIK